MVLLDLIVKVGLLLFKLLHETLVPDLLLEKLHLLVKKPLSLEDATKGFFFLDFEVFLEVL